MKNLLVILSKLMDGLLNDLMTLLDVDDAGSQLVVIFGHDEIAVGGDGTQLDDVQIEIVAAEFG